LANGATTLLFESTPLYPDASRYWDVVQRHKVTQFYGAPTGERRRPGRVEAGVEGELPRGCVVVVSCPR